MINEPVELSNGPGPHLYGSGIFKRIIKRNQNYSNIPEHLDRKYLFGNTLKSQPSIWQQMIHEITEAIALFLIILMRWFDLMRADSNDLALDRIRHWFWEWLDREQAMANSESIAPSEI